MSRKLCPSVIGEKEIFWLYVHIFHRLDFKSSVLVDPSVRPLFIGVPLSKAPIVDVQGLSTSATRSRMFNSGKNNQSINNLTNDNEDEQGLFASSREALCQPTMHNINNTKQTEICNNNFEL